MANCVCCFSRMFFFCSFPSRRIFSIPGVARSKSDRGGMTASPCRCFFFLPAAGRGAPRSVEDDQPHEAQTGADVVRCATMANLIHSTIHKAAQKCKPLLGCEFVALTSIDSLDPENTSGQEANPSQPASLSAAQRSPCALPAALQDSGQESFPDTWKCSGRLDQGGQNSAHTAGQRINETRQRPEMSLSGSRPKISTFFLFFELGS